MTQSSTQARNWRDLIRPKALLEEDRDSHSESYGKFVCEPLERGFGITIGNSLRRVLLSSLQGAAITAVRLDGALHEFTTIDDVKEDVTDIVLNLKQVLVRVEGDEPVSLKIDVTRKGPVTAGDIVCDQRSEIVNPDLVICTLTEKTNFQVELKAQKGRGYMTADEVRSEDMELGVIPLDCIFSPVKRVRYKVVDTRVGKITNYDKLILEIWTDGTARPEQALVEAAKIYRKHLNPFVHYSYPGEDAIVSESAVLADEEKQKEAERMRELLGKPIEELDLSVRARNCLDAENLQTVGELVRRTEADLLRIKNFGKTSLKEIKKKLQDLNLSLGMEVPDGLLPSEVKG